MTRRVSRWLLLALLALGAGLPITAPAVGAVGAGAAGADSVAPGPLAPLPQRTKLVYGVPPGVAFAVYVGLERGYFDEMSLDIEIEHLTNSAAITPNLVTGQLDLGHNSAAPGTFNAVARGLPIRAILDTSHYAPGGRSHVIMARQDLFESGQLQGVEQLRGRRVALGSVPGGLSIDLDLALRRVGMTVEDVESVQIPFVEQVAALANSSVDAAVTLEPFAMRVAERGAGQTIQYLNDVYPNHQVAFVMISNKLIERPELARAFASAYLRGARDYERARQFGQNVEEIAGFLSKYNQQPAQLVGSVFRNGGMTAIDPDGRINVESVQHDINWYRDRKYVDGDVSASAFVDSQYADYAVAALGPFR